MPVLLCHVVWMPFYAGEDEVHAAGHDNVREEGFGHELFNFMSFDGFCYGYVQSRSGTVNVSRLGADKEDTFVDDVTIIWTATSPQAERIIVGWYRNARIYRNFQRGNLKRHDIHGRKVGFYARAAAADCVLIPRDGRNFLVPHHQGKGLPGQSLVFYPEDSTRPEMAVWLERAEDFISAWKGKALGDSISTATFGWPSTPDAAHNAAVEAAAIAFIRSILGEGRDRQKDNCGWDLEFVRGAQILCVEVKGLSGPDLGVELTPNEYAAMKRAMTRL